MGTRENELRKIVTEYRGVNALKRAIARTAKATGTSKQELTTAIEDLYHDILKSCKYKDLSDYELRMITNLDWFYLDPFGYQDATEFYGHNVLETAALLAAKYKTLTTYQAAKAFYQSIEGGEITSLAIMRELQRRLGIVENLDFMSEC